jgi:hypothetical protein
LSQINKKRRNEQAHIDIHGTLQSIDINATVVVKQKSFKASCLLSGKERHLHDDVFSTQILF